MIAGSLRGWLVYLGLLLPIAGCSTPATTTARLGEIEAVASYRQAAEQGSAPAQLLLGLAYNLGQGIEMDKTEADHWWRTAALQGNDGAARNLMQLRSQSWTAPACGTAGIPRAWLCSQLPPRLKPLR